MLWMKLILVSFHCFVSPLQEFLMKNLLCSIVLSLFCNIIFSYFLFINTFSLWFLWLKTSCCIDFFKYHIFCSEFSACPVFGSGLLFYLEKLFRFFFALKNNHVFGVLELSLIFWGRIRPVLGFQFWLSFLLDFVFG